MLPAFFHLEDGGFCPPGAKTGPKGKENEKKPGLRSADFEHKKMAERGGFEPPEGYPIPFFVNVMDPEYVFQFTPSREYSFLVESALKDAVTFTKT